MKLVADTNTFLAVALNEPERERIINLTLGHKLVAPEILPFELGNALSALRRRGRLSSIQAMDAWDAIQAVPVELQPVAVRPALLLADRFGIYAYDAYYLDCALTSHLPLLTLDKGMVRVAVELGIKCLEETS